MLGLPEIGLSRSIEKHNCDLDILCDWIEASAVFSAERISKADVLDDLLENGIYEDQDFATQFVDDAWEILSHRFSAIGHPLGIRAHGNRIRRENEWRIFPAYAFCLLLSCTRFYRSLRDAANGDYREQGLLFEELSTIALARWFKGWKVQRIGWTPSNVTKLNTIVDKMVKELREMPGPERDIHVTNAAKELGLDVVVYLPFPDPNCAIPVILVQCASGMDWESKRHTPDLHTWEKVVSFSSRPVRGLTIPFAFVDPTTFRRKAIPVNGILLERYRLLQVFAGLSTKTVNQLNARLVDWIDPRLQTIPMT